MKDTFEEGIARLEAIRRDLEQEQVPLSDMVGLYQEGMELSKKLSAMLDMTEKEILHVEGDTVDEHI